MRSLRIALPALVLGGLAVAACKPKHHKLEPQTPKPATTELSPALDPFAWLPGTYSDKGGSETWVAVQGALYGVSLHDDASWEVMIIDDADGPGPADGVLRFLAMPNGNPPVEFRERTVASTAKMQQIIFANDEHDFPKTISYLKQGDNLVAALGDGDPENDQRFEFAAAKGERAPELETADRAFSDDVAKRKEVGWYAAFAPNGWMMGKEGKIEGAAIAARMKDVLADGTLAWSAVASGKRGDRGFTVGKAAFTNAKTNTIEWRSTYATIWSRQPDGSWKVLFDVGRSVNE